MASVCKQCHLQNHEGCTSVLFDGAGLGGNPADECECRCEWSPLGKIQQAKDRLNKAIVQYYSEISPEDVVGDWVLIAHRMNARLEAEGQPVIGVTHPTGQHFHRTSGLVLEASKVL